MTNVSRIRISIICLSTVAFEMSKLVHNGQERDWVDITQGLITAVVVTLIVEGLLLVIEAKGFLEQLRSDLPKDVSEVRALISFAKEELDRQRATSITLDLIQAPGDEDRSQVFRKLLERQFHSVRDRSLSDLQGISRGYFELPVGQDIPWASFDLCKNIDKHAFCVSVEDQLQLFFNPSNHAQFLDENYEAAKRTLRNGGSFTRVFIMSGRISINSSVFSLMRRMSEEKIKVRLTFETLSEIAALDPRFFSKVERVVSKGSAYLSAGLSKASRADLDYGLWDNSTSVTIYGKPPVMRLTDDHNTKESFWNLSQQLSEASIPFEDYVKIITAPLNDWKDQGTDKLTLPISDGPHPLDAEEMLTSVFEKVSGPSGRIAVLGLTNEILEQIKRHVHENPQESGLECEVIDQRQYPIRRDGPLLYKKLNWLEWVPETLKSAIVGDDVLCNLTPWQLPYFFDRMSDALTYDGRLVIRTTCIHTPESKAPSKKETIDLIWGIQRALIELRKGDTPMDPMYFKAAAYELAWPMLHSSMDTRTSSFDIDEWNNEVVPRLPPELRELMKLNHGGLRITSLPFEELHERWSVRFPKFDSWPIHSVWEEPQFRSIPEYQDIANTFKTYYRVIELNKVPLK